MLVSTPDRRAESLQFRATRSLCRAELQELFFASHFLPKPLRGALYGVAAVGSQLLEIACPTPPRQNENQIPTVNPTAAGRFTDEPVADSSCCCCEAGDSGSQRRAVCMAILDHLYTGQPTGKPELDGFKRVADRYGLPRSLWDTFVHGLVDLESVRRYATWTRLRDHLDRTTGTIADLAVRVLSQGSIPDPSGRHRSAALGTGLGLALILAHLRQDLRKDRLRLPLDDLVRFGLTETDLKRFADTGTTGGDPRWQRLIGHETDRAKHLIRGGTRAAFSVLEPSARRATAVLAAIYLGLLEQISKHDLFAVHPQIGPWQRLRQLPVAIRMTAAAG